MKRRGAVLLLAVVAAVGLYAVPAGAEGSRGRHGRVLVVDKGWHHGSCYGKHHRRPYPTIQAAVDAARSGDTIKVCPGLYEETVKVETDHLTIKGAKAGVDATEREGRRESVVTSNDATGTVQLLADHITWDGFKIRDNTAGPGLYTSPDRSGYLIRDTIFLDNGSGIHLGSSGEHPTVVCRNRFTANNEFEGPTGAFGIYSSEGARQVLITSNRFERHNTAAVFFTDEGVDDVLIEHNKSVDDLTFVSIFNSTRVRVTANWIRARVGDTQFPGPASAIFVGAGNDDVIVQKNKVASASGNGIHVTDTGPVGTPPTNVIVRWNKVEHALEFGIEISATGAGEYRVLANRSRTNAVGIHLGLGTSGVVVDGNTALDNTLDCQDESNPLANTWQDNVGVTSNPSDAALCTAPTELTEARYDRDHDDDGKYHDKRKHKKHHKKMKKHKKHHRPDPCVCTLPWRF
jgi:nitrous oxidase accessory protein NosD